MTVSDSSVPVPVSGYLARNHIDPSSIVPLTGDASDRRYFRVVPRGGSPFVLAVNAAPFHYATLPFVNVAELLAAMPVPIPALLGHAEDLGVLALDDLGDVTLQARLGAASPTDRLRLYREAVSLIEIIQRRGNDLRDPRFISYDIAFDVEKLTWEMSFFVKHFLEAYRGASISSGDRVALMRELSSIVEVLANEPRVLCHRDYHSRNLMLWHDRLYVIDFQDARMGPDTYDLVSLLRDSYVDLPEDVVDTLIDDYLAATGRAGAGASFRKRFDLMALQRNLKALGTFGYQTTTRGNPVYIQYIPRTLLYARNTLFAHERFAALRAVLSNYITEWQG